MKGGGYKEKRPPLDEDSSYVSHYYAELDPRIEKKDARRNDES